MTLRTEHISQCSRIKARKIDLFVNDPQNH